MDLAAGTCDGLGDVQREAAPPGRARPPRKPLPVHRFPEAVAGANSNTRILQKGYTQKLWISIIGRVIGQAAQLPG
jgi:hypothetical protein